MADKTIYGKWEVTSSQTETGKNDPEDEITGSTTKESKYNTAQTTSGKQQNASDAKAAAAEDTYAAQTSEPQTGDDSSMTLIGILAMAAALGAGVAVLPAIRRRQTN